MTAAVPPQNHLTSKPPPRQKPAPLDITVSGAQLPLSYLYHTNPTQPSKRQYVETLASECELTSLITIQSFLQKKIYAENCQ